jgi:hypothetical protein
MQHAVEENLLVHIPRKGMFAKSTQYGFILRSIIIAFNQPSGSMNFTNFMETSDFKTQPMFAPTRGIWNLLRVLAGLGIMMIDRLVSITAE